jgi:hypothetical protein
MIAPGASTSPDSASVAMRAGTPIFDPPHKAASTQAGGGERRGQSRRGLHQDSTIHRAIVRWKRITETLHLHGEDDPDRPSRL